MSDFVLTAHRPVWFALVYGRSLAIAGKDKSLLREMQLKSHARNGLVAGSMIAFLASVFVSLSFKPALMEPLLLVAWYIVSVLIGGAAGLAAGLLVHWLPVRLSPAASYLAGALFGAFGFFLQLSLFLLFMFRTSPTSF